MAEGFDYRRMVHEASISVVRKVLETAASEGLPGEHHLFVTFATTHPEARLPPALRAQFPETMTVVLQHQYWDLTVEAEAFEVTLRFGGALERLRVPFGAITTFIDPSVPFGLDLSPFGGGAAAEPGGGPEPEPTPEPAPEPALEAGPEPPLRPVAVAPLEDPPPPAPGPGGGEVLPFRRR